MTKLTKFEWKPKDPEKTKTEFIIRLRQAFDTHPDVEKVYIQGYVPYFNDGDVCVFHIQGVHTDKCEEQEWYDWSDGWGWVSDFEECLQRMFGDHWRVTITRDLDVTHEEYDSHD